MITRINDVMNRTYNALPEGKKLVMGTAVLGVVAGLAYQNIDVLKSLAERGVEMFGTLSPTYQLLLKAVGIALLIRVIGEKMGIGERIDTILELVKNALVLMYVLQLEGRQVR